jgi:hypothetical protein
MQLEYDFFFALYNPFLCFAEIPFINEPQVNLINCLRTSLGVLCPTLRSTPFLIFLIFQFEWTCILFPLLPELSGICSALYLLFPQKSFISTSIKLHNEELHNVYSSPDAIRMIKSKNMRCAGHVARMGRRGDACRMLVEKPEGKRPLGRTRRKGLKW